MVEHVKPRGEQSERSPDAHGQRDDAHVLDRRVGQQTLEVVLDEHERDSDDDRDRAEAEKQIRRELRSQRSRGQQVEAEDRVERAVEQRAREEHAHRGGRLAVRIGQPGVHRRETRLRPKADEHQCERHAHERGVQRAGVRTKLVPIECRGSLTERLACRVVREHQPE